jgi:hypothetical protein
MPKYRIARNTRNTANSPWYGAVGVEEVSDPLTVPSSVCWFSPRCETLAQHVVDLLNAEAAPDVNLMSLHDRVMDRFNADGSIVDRDVLALLSMLCKKAC